jgi:N-terminal acetyltransferase B complex non-catalytic subunit
VSAGGLMARYRAARPLVSGADPREPTPADTLALLATQALAAEGTAHAAKAAAAAAAAAATSESSSSLGEATLALLAAVCAAEVGPLYNLNPVDHP